MSMGKSTPVLEEFFLRNGSDKAWEQVSTDKDMVIRSFQKVGISVAVDGSEDDKINIEGLPGYTVKDSDEESESAEEDEESEDPFDGCSDEEDEESD